MRLKNFINEETAEQLAVYDEVIPQIKKDCGPWIHSCGGGMLLRGTWALKKADVKKPWKIVTTRTDRRPTDTPNELHKLVDQVFLEEWGYKARSESVFCTSNWQTITGKYGPATIIIPIGNFKFLWSKTINDLWEDYLAKIEATMGFKQDWEILAQLQEDIPDLYTSRDLPAAIKSKHEVMIKCEKYYLLEDTHTPKFRFRYKELF